MSDLVTRVAQRFSSRPGPHWNPWPQKPESLREDLDTLHELASSKAVEPAVGRVLGLIWNMIVNHAMKDEGRAPQALERARKAFESLKQAEKAVVPRTIVDLLHGLKLAFSASPQAAQTAMHKLLQTVKRIELPDGPDYEMYIETIDAYRDVMFFVKKFLDPVEYRQLLHRLKALEVMSDNPFMPDKAMQKDRDVFRQAERELVFLETGLEEALAAVGR